MAKKTTSRKSRPIVDRSAPEPAKTQPDPEPSKPATTPEHPALTLLHALNSLRGVCLSAREFRELAERRKRARDQHTDFTNLRLKIASDRANEMGRAGATFAEQLGPVLSEVIDSANESPPSSEPAEYRENLRERVLDKGREYCARALTALAAGGASGLDAATQPNAAGQARSIELHTKLQDADLVFVRLMAGISHTQSIIGDDAERMAELGEWFERAGKELRAVIDTRGLDAPAPTPTDRSIRSARTESANVDAQTDMTAGGAGGDATQIYPIMYDLASAAGISDDTFRRIRNAAGIEVKLKGAAARNRRYNPSEVDRLIAAALAGNYIERAAMAEKWARWGSR